MQQKHLSHQMERQCIRRVRILCWKLSSVCTSQQSSFCGIRLVDQWFRSLEPYQFDLSEFRFVVEDRYSWQWVCSELDSSHRILGFLHFVYGKGWWSSSTLVCLTNLILIKWSTWFLRFASSVHEIRYRTSLIGFIISLDLISKSSLVRFGGRNSSGNRSKDSERTTENSAFPFILPLSVLLSLSLSLSLPLRNKTHSCNHWLEIPVMFLQWFRCYVWWTRDLHGWSVIGCWSNQMWPCACFFSSSRVWHVIVE